MPDIAFLGLAIETDQLKKAHEELSKLPAAAGAAEQSTKKLTEAAKALGESADKSAAAARRMTQYDDAATAIHRSAQAAKEADNAFKSATASASSMVRASAANAAQMAQNSTHPLYGALTKGAKEATGELQKTAAATAEYAAVQARAAEATKKVSEQVKTLSNLSSRDRILLGYQLNDIFTQLASGQNPLMIAAQQGPQITQIFGGLRATLAAIPKAWLIGGGAALGVGIFGAILKSINEMNDAIEEQRRPLGTLLGGRDQAVAAYRDITKFASATGIAVSEATEKFVVFGRATQSLGATRQGILSIAAVVEQLPQISGASESEGGAARTAIAGMLKDSTVSAEELRTVLANVPQIADQIAAGLGV
jgi:tape measure domain-containing protein